MSLEKSDRRLLTTGIIGTVIAALCCFTPVLAVLFGPGWGLTPTLIVATSALACLITRRADSRAERI